MAIPGFAVTTTDYDAYDGVETPGRGGKRSANRRQAGGGIDWRRAGVRSETVTAPIARGLIVRNATGRALRLRIDVAMRCGRRCQCCEMGMPSRVAQRRVDNTAGH
jgi:hypothetical protein